MNKINYLLHRNMSLSGAVLDEHHFKIEARELLGLPTDKNVRDAIKRDSNVAKAIRNTIEDKSDWFHILNGGITIVADHIKIDNGSNTIILRNPSIINGAQTQGALEKCKGTLIGESGEPLTSMPVSVFILITDDNEVKADISIARNNQTPVKITSMMGARDMFDELEDSIRKVLLGFRMEKSESDTNYDITASRLMQLLFLALPEHMRVNKYSIAQTYSGAAKWYKEFHTIWDIVHGNINPNSKLTTQQIKNAHVAYNFFMEHAVTIVMTYQAWKIGHNSYKSYSDYKNNLFKRSKDNDPNKKEIHDGILFPVLNCVYRHLFVKRKTYLAPKVENKIMSTAHTLYKTIGDPQRMGKSSDLYAALWELTEDLKN